MEISPQLEYYYNNRERILKRAADKKTTADGRAAFREYHRNYKRKRRALAGPKRPVVSAVKTVLRPNPRLPARQKKSPGRVRVSPSPHANPQPVSSLLISDVPEGYKRPASDFTISADSWN